MLARRRPADFPSAFFYVKTYLPNLISYKTHPKYAAFIQPLLALLPLAPLPAGGWGTE
mgnify:CR=1 FL=1